MSSMNRPDVPTMLISLRRAYETLIAAQHSESVEQARLLAVADNFMWYAERLGPTRIETPPRPNRWSFAENLWHVTTQAVEEAEQGTTLRIVYFIDHGKEHVGQAAEIIALFGEHDEAGE